MTDEQLVYLINECHNKQAFDILYQKHFNNILSIVCKYVFNKFYNLSFEQDDLISECYYSFLNAVKTYDYIKYKLPFIRFLFLVVRNDLFAVAKQTLQQRNKFVNNFISFNKFENIDCIESLGDLNSEQKLIENLMKEELLTKIKKMQEDNPKQYLGYSTILLRLEGYSLREICCELKVTKKFVSNFYSTTIKKLRNIFNDDI